MELRNKNIKEKFKTIIEQENFLLVDFLIRGNPNNRIIEIFIDGDEAVTTKDCSMISRQLNFLIEEEEIFTGKYRLDVSSPGVDKPLLFLRQYPKHLNREFSLKYKENEDSKNFEGKLKNIKGDILTFASKNEERKINFNQITKAKVKISF
ncbi:ribosome maturation factor RimP [bacterium BMS3Abin04]|nr:ribosome maturation factor RimP [bacterium BMS3Abin04]